MKTFITPSFLGGSSSPELILKYGSFNTGNSSGSWRITIPVPEPLGARVVSSQNSSISHAGYWYVVGSTVTMYTAGYGLSISSITRNAFTVERSGLGGYMGVNYMYYEIK